MSQGKAPAGADSSVRYIVRNQNWNDEKIWGVDMEHKAALRRKELVAGRRLSRTVIVEEMPADPVFAAACRDVVTREGIEDVAGGADAERYAVLNFAGDVVWGLQLTLHDAKVLKDKVAGRRLSRSMVIAPMPTAAATLAQLQEALVAPETIDPPAKVPPPAPAAKGITLAPGIVATPAGGGSLAVLAAALRLAKAQASAAPPPRDEPKGPTSGLASFAHAAAADAAAVAERRHLAARAAAEEHRVLAAAHAPIEVSAEDQEAIDAVAGIDGDIDLSPTELAEIESIEGIPPDDLLT